MIDADHVRERLAVVEARIQSAGGIGVEVLAVTKGFGPDAIDAAIAAGFDRFDGGAGTEQIVRTPSRITELFADPDADPIEDDDDDFDVPSFLK